MPACVALRPFQADPLQRLRAAGRRVDLVLEPKRLKWAFKQAERCNAGEFVWLAGWALPLLECWHIPLRLGSG